jgi:photosystem II stability/assembly factor-like uncharacterized protein
MFSSAEPHALFEGSQVMFRSDDYGRTWKAISPDLTRNDKSTEGPSGGDVYWDQTGAETFPDIASIGFSPVNKDTIWAGSADGLVHVTQDGGTNWKDVTPKQMGSLWSRITSFETSQTDACTAFVTASRYMWDDMRPFIFKTTDCGANWTQTTNGIASDQTVYAVRIDPREPRVMFAGTRSRVYVSLNGGQSWQSLALNLPPVEVRDLAINAREGEVAIATHGRSFWILDHLQQVEDIARESSPSTSSAQVFAPETAWLTHAYGGGSYGPAGDNPDYGASVFFNLPSGYNGRTPVTLSFQDASGKTIRTFNLHLKNKKAKKYSGEDRDGCDQRCELSSFGRDSGRAGNEQVRVGSALRRRDRDRRSAPRPDRRLPRRPAWSDDAPRRLHRRLGLRRNRHQGAVQTATRSALQSGRR